MIISEEKQGTLGWLEERMGKVTASELCKLITPKWEIRTGEMPQTYLNSKLAERWLGEPIERFNGGGMEQGTLKEPEAVKGLAFEEGISIRSVGFVMTDDRRFGCSPDGMITEREGVEAKSPLPHTHIKYLRGGKVPDDYVTQVQGAMFATGGKYWLFTSYCRTFPRLLLRVERDEKAMEVIAKVVEKFNHDFDAGWADLVEKNGGEPVRTVRTSEENGEYTRTLEGVSTSALDDFLRG